MLADPLHPVVVRILVCPRKTATSLLLVEDGRDARLQHKALRHVAAVEDVAAFEYCERVAGIRWSERAGFSRVLVRGESGLADLRLGPQFVVRGAERLPVRRCPAALRGSL
jgi:hypothetical protein